MDYKMIHPNGSPFTWQESREHSDSVQSSNVASKFINMLISLFK